MYSFLTLLSSICPRLVPSRSPVVPFYFFLAKIDKLNICRASLAFCPLVPPVPHSLRPLIALSSLPIQQKKAAAVSDSSLSSFGAHLRASPQPNRERIC